MIASENVPQGKAVWIAAGLLALGALLAYANSFSVPLLFDDSVTIRDNPLLRNPWPIWSAFSPPENSGVGGRPIANVSLVLNYALTGDSVAGLHAVNLAIHFGAALALFGILRRTLNRRQKRDAPVAWLALAAAGWWMLHPLQTQSVTYISQRTESLMGLFYFLTLYAFIRGIEAGSAKRWFLLSVACCWAGMATKEGMVTVPVMVFLYDYAFETRSFRESWRRRWPWYVAMAVSWVMLGALMSGLRSRGVGFGLGTSWGAHLLIECRAVLRYLVLSIWPHPLVFDYGLDLGPPGGFDAAAAGVLAVLAVATVVALRRVPALGFLGAWFFITLSPTSSVVPIPLQPISENRAYVPSAAVVVMLAILGYRWHGWRSRWAFGGIAVALAGLTVARNADYRSETTIWADTVAKRPSSSRAHSNYGHALQSAGRLAEAREQHEIALRIRPNYSEPHASLAAIFGQLGMPDRALQHAQKAIEIDPTNTAAYFNLALASANLGNHAAAILAFEKLLTLSPNWAQARSKLALALLQTGRHGEAVAQSDAALRLKPDLVEARFALACGLALSGRGAETIPLFQDVVRAEPNHLDAWQNLASVLLQAGRAEEAIAAAESALRINPNHPGANFVLGNALLAAGRASEAASRYLGVLRVAPNSPEVHANLGDAYARLGRGEDAAASYAAALRQNPNLPQLREKLERLQAGRR